MPFDRAIPGLGFTAANKVCFPEASNPVWDLPDSAGTSCARAQPRTGGQARLKGGAERRRTGFGCVLTSEMLKCVCLRVALVWLRGTDPEVVKTDFPEDVADLLKSATRCCQPAPASGWIILRPTPSSRGRYKCCPAPPPPPFVSLVGFSAAGRQSCAGVSVWI